MRKWIDGRNTSLPPRTQGLIRYEIDLTDRAITILECRPPWHDDMGNEWTRHPICRFRYTKVRNEWSLYWSDRHLRFREYGLVPPTPLIDDLIAEVDRDPTSIFWG